MSKICVVTLVQVRRKRQAMGVRPYVKQVDTLAAEFPASTNYLYMTYSGNEDDIEHEEMVRCALSSINCKEFSIALEDLKLGWQCLPLQVLDELFVRMTRVAGVVPAVLVMCDA